MPDLWCDVDAAVTVPVNILPLCDDVDFKTVEEAIVYNFAGLSVQWNFQTSTAFTCVAVTPTTGGDTDWIEPLANVGMYSIEIPASGGSTINNDTEGVGWFTGKATGVLPWRGPTIGFRRAALNDLFRDGGTASTNLEDFFDGTGYAGGTAKLTVDVTKIGGQATTAAAPVAVLASVGTAATATAQTGDCYPLLNTELADLITTVGVAGAGLTSANIGQAALVANNLDHLCKTATAAADMTTEVADGTIISRMISNSDTSLFVPGTHSLQIVGADVAATHAHAGAADTNASALVTTVGVAGAGLTSVNIGQLAIVANKLDHLVLTADADDVADNSIIAKLAAKGATADWSTYVNTTDSLEANRDNIGTTGAGLTTLATVPLVSSVTAIAAGGINNAAFAADVGSTALATNIIGKAAEKAVGVAGVALTSTGIPAATVTALGTGSTLTTLTPIAASVIADAVWDEVVTTGAHDTATYAGKQLLDANNGAPIAASAIADAVWDEVLHSDHEVASSASVLVQDAAAAGAGISVADILDHDVTTHTTASTVGKLLNDVLADTGELQAEWADGGRSDLILDAAATGANPWSTALPGAYGAGTAGYIVGNAPTQAAVATAVTHEFLDHNYTEHTAASSVGKWFNAVRTLLGHKSIENAGSTSVSYKATDDSTESGTISWDEANKTRGKYTGW